MVRRCRDLASLVRDVSIKSSNVQKRFLPEQDYHSHFNLHQPPRPRLYKESTAIGFDCAWTDFDWANVGCAIHVWIGRLGFGEHGCPIVVAFFFSLSLLAS